MSERLRRTSEEYANEIAGIAQQIAGTEATLAELKARLVEVKEAKASIDLFLGAQTVTPPE